MELIWNFKLTSREWSGDPRIGGFVARKLSLCSGRKGFGNAREVEKLLERAIQDAFSKEDFNGTLFLNIENVAGEDPTSNPKLQAIFDTINSKIGWKSIKEAAQELITVAETNYHRALEGEDPSDIVFFWETQEQVKQHAQNSMGKF